MKKLELQNFGVTELNTEEMVLLNGGIDFTKLLKGSIASFVATQVIAHWSEIKSGFVAGFSDRH